MDIGQAITEAKAGGRVARRGWNSQDQYVYYIPAQSYPAHREYLALKTPQHDVATWAPSVGDVLATDWYTK